MKTVIVADVHQQLELVQSILKREGDAKYIWLGDWFDDYNDSPMQASWTAKWLYQRTLSNPDDVFLLGNHDAWYMWPNVFGLRCSGNSSDKAAAIRDCMDIKAYQDRVKLWATAGPWLLSHAGFSEDSYSYLGDGHDMTKARVVYQLEEDHRVHPLLGAGRARGGPRERGGVTWLDFRHEFVILKGVHQVFGHTRANEPRWKNSEDPLVSSNLCLDTHTHHYAVLNENDDITLKENV